MNLKNNFNGKGRLGRDPEYIETSPGKFKAKFSLAITEYIKGENKTSWFNCVAFGKTVDRMKARHLSKGDYIEVCGPLRPYEYQWNNETRREINILVDNFDILIKASSSQVKPSSSLDTIRNDENKAGWNFTKETNSCMDEPWKKYDNSKVPF